MLVQVKMEKCQGQVKYPKVVDDNHQNKGYFERHWQNSKNMYKGHYEGRCEYKH